MFLIVLVAPDHGKTGQKGNQASSERQWVGMIVIGETFTLWTITTKVRGVMVVDSQGVTGQSLKPAANCQTTARESELVGSSLSNQEVFLL